MRRSAGKVRAGASVVREELSRDDSLIQYLELNNLYGVSMGKKDRALVVARLRGCQSPRQRQLLLDGRVEPVSLGQRQLAGQRSGGIHRPRARSHWRDGHRSHAVGHAMPVLLAAALLLLLQPAPRRPASCSSATASPIRTISPAWCASSPAPWAAGWCARASRSPTTDSRITGTPARPGRPSPAAAGTSSCCSRDRRRCPSRAGCLIDYTRRFDAEIKKAGARTALYMVWPSRQRRGDAEGGEPVVPGGRQGGGRLLLPVGDAWREAWAVDARSAAVRGRQLPSLRCGHLSRRARRLSPSPGRTRAGHARSRRRARPGRRPAAGRPASRLAGTAVNAARRAQNGYSVHASMPPPATSTTAVTRAIVLGTLAALIVVGTLSVLIYRSTVSGAIAQHSAQQLAMVRTAADRRPGRDSRPVGAAAPVQQPAQRAEPRRRVPGPAHRGRLRRELQRHRPLRGSPRRRWPPVLLDAEGRADGQRACRRAWIRRSGAGMQRSGQPRTRSGWDRPGGCPSRRSTCACCSRRCGEPRRAARTRLPPMTSTARVGLAIDLSRLVEVYLGPAITELADDQLVVGLPTRRFRRADGTGRPGHHARLRPIRTHTSNRRGSPFSMTQDGRRIHAWSQLDAADQSWLVASSSPYDRVAAQVQRSATGQLALMTMLLVAVPLGGMAAVPPRAPDPGRAAAARAAAGRIAEDGSDRQAGRRRRARLQQHADGDSRLLQHDRTTTRRPTRRFAIRRGQIRRAAESAAALTQKLLAFSRRQVLQTNQFDFAVHARQPAAAGAPRHRRGHHRDVETRAGPVAGAGRPGAGRAVDRQPGDQRPRRHARRRHAADRRPAMRRVRTASGGPTATCGRATTCRSPSATPAPAWTTRPGRACSSRSSRPSRQARAPAWACRRSTASCASAAATLRVTSTPGRGTSIELLLPRAPDLRRPHAGADPDAGAAGRRRRHGNGAGGRGRRCGAPPGGGDARAGAATRVIKAASGDEALRVADAFDGTIHLLLSDVVMPGMKGPELADAAARRCGRRSGCC